MRALVVICLILTVISAGLSGYLVYRLSDVEQRLTVAIDSNSPDPSLVDSPEDYTSRFDALDSAISDVSDSASKAESEASDAARSAAEAASSASDASSKVDGVCIGLSAIC